MLIIFSIFTIASENLYARWLILDTLKDHKGSVKAVAFRNDGQLLASGSQDGTVILWNPLTGEKIKTLIEHNDIVYSVAFGSDGLLASASLDGTIILWNSTRGEKLQDLTHNGVRCITFSPDGQFLASGAQNGEVKIWNSNTGEEQVQDILKHEGDVTSVAFSPDGTLLASGSYDSTVKLWNFKNRKIVKTLELKNLELPVIYVYSITFISDSQLAIGLQDGTIKLWNFTKDTATGVKVLQGHQSKVISIAFSPKIQLLASGSQNGTIKLWYPNMSAEQANIEGHRGSVNSINFSPDGKLLASGSDDGNVRLWQHIILSVRIKNEYSFPKTINKNRLQLNFIIEPQEIRLTGDIRYSYNLDAKGWVNLPKGQNFVLLSNLKDGEHKFEVKAVSATWEIDLTPAIVTFTVSPSPDTKITSQQMTKDSVIFYITGSDAQTETSKLRHQWRVDGGDWSVPSKDRPVTIPLSQYSLGEHVFEVRFIDDEGQFDPTPAKSSFTLTISEQPFPETRITNPPTEMIRTNTFTFNFYGEDSQTPKNKLRYSWRLNGGPWTDPSTVTKAVLTNLSAGWHIFEVKAIDTDDNEDPTPAEASFEVEEQLPETLITKWPEDPVKTENTTIQFSGRDWQTPTEELLYSWRIDGKSWSDPSRETIAVLPELSNGPHLFEVKAIDGDGNEDSSPMQVSFEVSIEEQLPDTQTEITDKFEQFPDTNIINPPKDPIKSPDFIFQLEGEDKQTPREELRYSWRIDQGIWTIPSDKTEAHPQGLSNGAHIFEVKAIDLDDNEDPTPAKISFQVQINQRLPNTRIRIKISKPINTNYFEIPFCAIDPQIPAKYSWRVDNGVWSLPSANTEAEIRNLSDGPHVFEVKAIVDGFEDPIPSSIGFVVDTKQQYPDTKIMSPLTDLIKTADITIRFHGEDSQTPEKELKYTWRIDGKPWSETLSDTTVRITNLSNGWHLFEVKSVDADGYEDQKPDIARFEVKVDSIFPDTQIDSYEIKKANAVITFTGIDSETPMKQLKYSWRIDEKPWSVPTQNETRIHLKGLSNGKHHFQVKAIDEYKNEDPTPAKKEFWIFVPWYKTMYTIFGYILGFVLIMLFAFNRSFRNTITLRTKRSLRKIETLIGNVENVIKASKDASTEYKVKQLIFDFSRQKDDLQILGRASSQFAHAMKTPFSAIDIGVDELSYEIQRIFKLMNQYDELPQLDNLEQIKSGLQRLQRKREEMRLEQYISSILKDTRMAFERVIEQVDDFSSITKEYELEGELTEINLNDIISRVVRILKKITYESADIRFTVGEIPPFRCYAGRLVTALIAITENSLEAISNNGYVEISTEYQPSDKSVLISIQDTGPGIPKDIRNKVWEEFFTTKEGKAGIGLSIAKDIIEDELHGKIWFESVEEKGTTFFIKLNTETFKRSD